MQTNRIKLVIISICFIITTIFIIWFMGKIEVLKINYEIIIRESSFISDRQELVRRNEGNEIIYYNRSQGEKMYKCAVPTTLSEIKQQTTTIFYSEEIGACSTRKITINKIDKTRGFAYIYNTRFFVPMGIFFLGLYIVGLIYMSISFTKEFKKYRLFRYFEKHKPTYFKRVSCNCRKILSDDSISLFRISAKIELDNNKIITIKKNISSLYKFLNYVDVLVDVDNPKMAYVTESPMENSIVEYYEKLHNKKNEE